MIRASYSPHVSDFFSRYISFILKSDFHQIIVNGAWNPEQKGSLIIGNHVSWWDGFFGLYLNNRFLKKKFHFMMLEEELSLRKKATWIGAFSIKPGSREIIESLRYSSELLSNRSNSVLMFPQGKINSIYNSTFNFEQGIEKILKLTPQCQLLFYAVFVDYFSNRKPSLYFYLKEVPADEALLQGNLQQLYQSFYDESFELQSKLTV
jgi:hypothetical protein